MLKKKDINYLNELASRKGGKCLSTEYINSSTKYIWQCSEGHTWEATANNIRKGTRCPYCVFRHSRSELEIYEFVKSLNPHVVSGKRGLLTNRKFELDIYIPSLKKAIEFDGIYWHESKWAKDRGIPERDARKDEECKKAGITLLRIQEEYYASLPDQVRGIIKAFLETQENE